VIVGQFGQMIVECAELRNHINAAHRPSQFAK
jgi:hypothetical protein